MDATLVTVTVLSMGMAAALSAIVWRMLRLERQRSNARVAALNAVALGARAKPAPVEDDLPIAPRVADAPRSFSDGGPVPRSFSEGGGMFAEREPASPWGPRLAVMVAFSLILASIVLFSLAMRGAKPSGAVAAKTPPASEATTTAGLELLALHDTRQSGSLTITGRVQNPRTGSTLSRIAVTAYTFDAGGSFLASGRALIDVTSLAPGEESPFTVTVPVGDTVARYRIGFRDDSGHVVGHVDRRQQGPVASNW